MSNTRQPEPPWTRDELEILRREWGRGLTASQISDMLPGRSRSAVIGQVTRRGYVRNPDAGFVKITRPRSAASVRKMIATKWALNEPARRAAA